MPADPFLQQSLESVQSVQTTLAPGQAVFGGRFVLERHLGQGGMGQVWLARDTALDEPRALKFVLPALLTDATARKRLRNEARLGTHLAHPRIVRVFDFAEETGGSPLAAVVMEYVEGRTLNELLAEQEIGFFEPEQIESWVNDVIEGLRYAHEEKQRYHLDLKPGNIIIETVTNRAKLLDFGISRSAKDTLTRLTGQASSGTLPYMSPQQLDGEPPCAADDVYGLGATIYELITGTPPFFRGKLEDQIRTKEPDSLMDRRRQNAKEGLNAGVGRPVRKTWEDEVSAMLKKQTPQRRLGRPNCEKGRAYVETNLVGARAAASKNQAPPGDERDQTGRIIAVFAAGVLYTTACVFAGRWRSDLWEGVALCASIFIVFYAPLFGFGKRTRLCNWATFPLLSVSVAWGIMPIGALLIFSLCYNGYLTTKRWMFPDGIDDTWTFQLALTSMAASIPVALIWKKGSGSKEFRLPPEKSETSAIHNYFLAAAIMIMGAFIYLCSQLTF